MKLQNISWTPLNPLLCVSEAVTDGIRVRVESFYVPERSEPRLNAYFFAYKVRIANEGHDAAQVLGRRWLIADGHGLVSHVKGDGVVGEQPSISAGESYDYTSACPLSTHVGFMKGSYRLVRPDGTEFEARIAEFALIAPGTAN